MSYRFFIIFLSICHVSKQTEVLFEDEDQRCKKNNTILMTGEGKRTALVVDVSFGERCYFVFTPKDNSYQCCYDGLNNFCEISQKYERGDDSKCLDTEQYSLKIDSEETQTCVLMIKGQSWKMSNLLHGPISTNQILPREKGVNRDIFGTSNLQNRTYGVSCDE